MYNLKNRFCETQFHGIFRDVPNINKVKFIKKKVRKTENRTQSNGSKLTKATTEAKEYLSENFFFCKYNFNLTKKSICFYNFINRLLTIVYLVFKINFILHSHDSNLRVLLQCKATPNYELKPSHITRGLTYNLNNLGVGCNLTVKL